jgi:hypothetical protein
MSHMEIPLIDLLYRALNSPRGTIIETSDPERLRQKLYAERKKDPVLECLSFVISPSHPASQLWIVKKNAQTST